MANYLLVEGSAKQSFEHGHIWGYCPECQVKESMEDILFEETFRGVSVKNDDKGILVIWEDGSWSRYIKLAN